MILQILLLCVGFVLLVKGADFFVDGAAGIAGKLGIPQLIVGLTIVAMGTSLPEAAVSITSALKDVYKRQMHRLEISVMLSLRLLVVFLLSMELAVLLLVD